MSATQWGGAIAIGSQFNPGLESLATAASLQHALRNVTVRNARAEMEGGVAYVKGGVVSLSGVAVSNASSAASGGAFYVEEGQVTIRGCRFANVSAALGGGVAWVGGALSVSDTQVRNASAGNDGGALFLTTTPFLKALFGDTATLGPGLLISGASAGDTGGAVYINGPRVVVVNASMSDCAAENSGGCLAAFSGLLLANSSFSRCAAGGAGGAVVVASLDITLRQELIASLQEDEERLKRFSDDDGDNVTIATADISDVSFSSCSCSGSAPKGGALAVIAANATVRRANFANCSVTVEAFGSLCPRPSPQLVRDITPTHQSVPLLPVFRAFPLRHRISLSPRLPPPYSSSPSHAIPTRTTSSPEAAARSTPTRAGWRWTQRTSRATAPPAVGLCTPAGLVRS